MSGIITLTTDFGLEDPYAGIMKGVILGINPEARLVDLTHQLKSFDVLEGALALAQSYPYFPPRTIHLVVVDPGVGTGRRAIMVITRTARFIGPDNGVFTLVYEREPGFEVRALSSPAYFLQPVSQTFHGRDIFAPSAAWLSSGLAPEHFGPVVSDFARLSIAKPEQMSPALVRGEVLHVDKFGNLITNLQAEHLPAGEEFRLIIKGCSIGRLVSSYAAGRHGEMFAIVGSSGFIEIAANQASAALTLGAKRGVGVRLEIG